MLTEQDRTELIRPLPYRSSKRLEFPYTIFTSKRTQTTRMSMKSGCVIWP